MTERFASPSVQGHAAPGPEDRPLSGAAVRERIPILSILLNNFSMAIELKVMPISTEKYRSTDISGDYAAMARAFGGRLPPDIGFGCGGSPDVLRVQRRGPDEIAFPDCADFPSPLKRCVAR